jgi:hypothetical protein
VSLFTGLTTDGFMNLDKRGILVIDIHLYGNLRRHAGHYRPGESIVLRQEPRPGETLASLLEQVGIPASEIGHIFLNARLLATHTAMAPLYGYAQERSSVFDWDLSVPIDDGDRIGLFGTDLPVLGM